MGFAVVVGAAVVVVVATVVVVGATTFGLATDYAVLVLARIKEYHDLGHDTDESIALGIDRTGRVISAAALLLALEWTLDRAWRAEARAASVSR